MAREPKSAREPESAFGLLLFNLCRNPWVDRFKDFRRAVASLARSFGRACGNPMPYVPRLIEEFQSALEGQAHPECALCALAEIALRDAETLRDHSVRICEEVSYILRVNPTACRISKWTGESA